jgi:TRAP-type C4-dicarboxylate transport system substrate-binding protein
LSGWVPEGQILDLPFLFRDRDHLARVLAGPLGDELKGKYEAQGFVVLGFINYGARHLLAKEPLTTPARHQGQAHPRDPEPAPYRALVRAWRLSDADPDP